MRSFFIFVLFFGTAVLAKGGVSSGSSSGGRSSSSSGGDSDAQVFAWTPYLLFQFILAITFGVFTLFGGGYWLVKRYNPATKAAGSTALLWTTWITWGLSITFYIFAAISAASFATMRGGGGIDLHSLMVAWVAPAFENLATAGWMIVLLGHAYRMWRTSNVAVDHPRWTQFLFYMTFTSLVISALLGGAIGPATIYIWDGSGIVPNNVQEIQNAYVRFTTIVASVLLSNVLVIRRATRRIEGFKSIDPLRWIVFPVIPLWFVTELARLILAIVASHADSPVSEVLNMTRFYFSTVPSIIMFGIASLATVIALPFAVGDAQRSKEIEV